MYTLGLRLSEILGLGFLNFYEIRYPYTYTPAPPITEKPAFSSRQLHLAAQKVDVHFYKAGIKIFLKP